MKTRCIVFIGLLFSTFASYGQARFGIQGSVQSSNLSISSSGVNISFDRKIGFRAGVMVDLPFGSDALSFRPQFLYSTKGFSLPSSFGGGTGSGNSLTLNYLEVPLQFMYGLSAGSGKVTLGAGPYVAYLLSQSDGTTSSSTVDDAQNRFDLGATLSAGYDTAGGLTLSAYFSPGFINLAKDASQGTGTSTSLLNTAFGLNIGYFFGAR
ncbi:porin family protein [Fibrella aquatilis]|uniref:PorT family protein n=1 Tax=Fibrella aquatilis TaxID=2817059 RepID=A0A939G655_9BACT|nr:porin family protein [Fibrella aquatilis]MBO0932869.1 PorT family protein [Fibrella aquatilis]